MVYRVGGALAAVEIPVAADFEGAGGSHPLQIPASPVHCESRIRLGRVTINGAESKWPAQHGRTHRRMAVIRSARKNIHGRRMEFFVDAEPPSTSGGEGRISIENLRASRRPKIFEVGEKVGSHAVGPEQTANPNCARTSRITKRADHLP